ncbi:hypothetical protein COO60DRAFT_1517879, partial [Scenedesmus sp. NREL 46B-D3]
MRITRDSCLCLLVLAGKGCNASCRPTTTPFSTAAGWSVLRCCCAALRFLDSSTISCRQAAAATLSTGLRDRSYAQQHALPANMTERLAS